MTTSSRVRWIALGMVVALALLTWGVISLVPVARAHGCIAACPSATDRGNENGQPTLAVRTALTDCTPPTYPGLLRRQAPQPLDFERAEISTRAGSPPQFVLQVSGTTPYVNMAVRLVPHVYIQQPEYWGIAVVGCLGSIGLPAQTPYTVTLPLAGVTGTRGVEVIGATRSERLAVPPEPAPQGPCREWTAWVDRQPLGPSVLHVTATCEFPTAGYTVELRRHVPQGFNPHNLLLELVVRPPSGPVPQVVTTVPVHYREETTTGFDTVTILPDGVTIPVQEVF